MAGTDDLWANASFDWGSYGAFQRLVQGGDDDDTLDFPVADYWWQLSSYAATLDGGFGWDVFDESSTGANVTKLNLEASVP